MPSVPVLIYDGHCSFCRIWLGYAQAQLGNGVEWLPSQEAGDRFSEIPREAFKESVYFVDSQGHIFTGAEAIFALLALVPGRAWPLRLHRTFRLFAWLCNSTYRVIAHHRDLAYTATRIAFGSKILPLRYGITESLFLRSLGLIFLIAFWSFHQQILALAGSRGIIPAARVLAGMRPELGSYPWLAVPSIFWWNASDAWLSGACSAGMAASLLFVISGWLGSLWQRLSILVCFGLYLSLIMIGEPFTSFQWDALLLEAAFLALFAGTPLLVWPFRVLLFRLMFESGCVKLLSGDPNWLNLHALRFHFMTQPLPSPLAWYVYQTPGWLLDLFTLATLVIETICPFLLFFPRRVRHASAILLINLQLLILVTGNYAFFNWLTIAICFWAFDDRTFSSLTRFLRKAVARTPGTISRRVCSTVLAILMATGIAQVLSMFTPVANVPFTPLLGLLRPWQIINSYGLFAVMTTTRPEITFEASNDGENWKEYSFPFKPGDLKRPLPLVAPFQPRLDWQLWFAALDGNYQEDRWTGNLAVRLLQGEPMVLHVLNPPPFSHPPRYVRALLYEYWFTSPAERKKTGAIWNRRFERTYLPPISLEALQQQGPRSQE